MIERIEGDGGAATAGDARSKLERLGAIAASGKEALGIDPLEVDLTAGNWPAATSRSHADCQSRSSNRRESPRQVIGRVKCG